MAAEEGQVIACHTVEAWNEQLQKGNDSKTLVISFHILDLSHNTIRLIFAAYNPCLTHHI